MPVYNVQSPDGRKFRVEAPKGANEAQVLEYAQANYKPRQKLSEVTGQASKLQQFRSQYPQYDQLPDDQLADALHRKFYSEMQRAEFDQRIGGQPAMSRRDELTALRRLDELETKARGGSKFGGIPVEGSRFGGIPVDDAPQAPNRLSQIESALRAADAAGNTDDARRLAQAYAQERDGQQPIQVEGTDGQLFEFPAGTPEETMTGALRRHYGGPESQRQIDPKSVRWDAPDPAQVQWDKPKPDFSNVRGGVQTFQRQRRPVAYHGPTLAGMTPHNGPTLDQINAINRAKRNAPGFAAEQARVQADNKRREFAALPAPARFAIGAGGRVAAAGRGAGQLFAQVADYVDPQEQNLSSLITGRPTSRYGHAMQREAQARQRDSYMSGDVAATLGGIAGDVGMLAAPGGAIGKLSGIRALAANAGLGAAYAGLQPVIDGESRAKNAGVGAAFGAGGHALASGVSALGRSAANAVPKDIQAMAKRARELGIPLHASQVSQSLPVKVAASAGKYLPFSGYAKAASRQQESVNRAVAKTFGSDAKKLTDDAMHAARRKLNSGFEDIYNRNTFPITEKVARKLVQVERDAARRLTNDEAQVLRNQLDDILANADDGVLSGQKYQAVRTSLKKAEGGDKLGLAVKELRQALDDMAAEAVGPADAAKLKTLRSQWANFRTAENALKQNAGAGGDVRLASLWPMIRKGSTKEMRELARMGQTLLKDPISDSGTAQRSLAYNVLMGGGSLANPALIPLFAKASLSGATLGRAANSSTLANLLAREGRGKATTKLGRMLEQSAPYVGPLAATRYNARGDR